MPQENMAVVQTNDTARLIEKVRRRTYLYDISAPDYKDREKKAYAWLTIASEMGYESGIYWSSKWKSLRDNYNKYKKSKNGTTAQSNKKYRNWPWAEYMTFLDLSYARLDSEPQDDPEEETKPSTSQSPPNEGMHEVHVPDSKITVKNIDFKHRRQKMKSASKKLSQKWSFDEVDLFFLSYAKNFKRLSRNSQALMKVEIATLFTRYELQDENEMDIQNSELQNNGLLEPTLSCAYEDNSE